MQPQPASKPPLADRTRDRILAVATEAFATAGYPATTIRQISKLAGVNIAAVNYHFGGKERLYQAVLHHAYSLALGRYPLDFGIGPEAAPEARLRAFVHALLLRMCSEGPHAHHGKLIAREMVDPSPALDAFARDDLQALVSTLRDILRGFLGTGADEQVVRFCGMSVVSQALFYHTSRAMISRLFPDLPLGPGLVPALADHITRFSLAGIRALARRPRAAGPPATGSRAPAG